MLATNRLEDNKIYFADLLLKKGDAQFGQSRTALFLVFIFCRIFVPKMSRQLKSANVLLERINDIDAECSEDEQETLDMKNDNTENYDPLETDSNTSDDEENISNVRRRRKRSDFQNNNNNLPRFHFAYIKKFSRLINHQVGNINNRKWYCERCLNHFSSALIPKKHIDYCKDLNNCKIIQ